MSNRVINGVFKLVGPHKGKTLELNGFRFVDGICRTKLNDEQHKMAANYLAANLQAEDITDGDASEAGQGQGGPNNSGSANGATVDGGGANAAAAGAKEPATSGENGHQDGDPVAERVRNALNQLDVDDDTHWTTNGRPALAIVEELAQTARVTRAELEVIAPGFNREAARAAKQK